ncbi:MAG: DNA helicase UvrD [Acidobacteria bacterium]|nr:DNA helicase UvrD [Acidobacteriota bacterium]
MIPLLAPVPPPDAADRARALDASASFIVQAPAGSGKTELLIQRYLTLLARVAEPECVVAITFTRKAAAEMRERVLAALESAQGEAPVNPHQETTWRAARQALLQDQMLGWQLAQHPNRMRIETIDALCYSLVQRMPWLARLGAGLAVTERPDEQYREAARNTIRYLDGEGTLAAAVAALLLHQDNNLAMTERLLAEMLERRDQWLPLLGLPLLGGSTAREQIRAALESGLEELIRGKLAQLRRAVPTEHAAELVTLARFAAANLVDEQPERDLVRCLRLEALPGSAAEDLPAWCGVAELLLVQGGSWRSNITKNTGFPPSARTMKDRLSGLLSQLYPREALRAALDEVRRLPPARLSEPQWRILQALFDILRHAAAELGAAFPAAGHVDFAEITAAALRALGTRDHPTDLSLALGHRVEHLLIDEFQDTSLPQVELVRRLTATWEPGEGRTLFLVGDPMQSIYRFREAQVGLYLDAQENGVGGITLEKLSLSANFRSRPAVVDWVNQTFGGIFPQEPDVVTGAVTYTPSAAVREEERDSGVWFHAVPTGERDDRAEAVVVADLVAGASVSGTVAILVEARSHLPAILAELRKRGIRFRAVEIDELSRRAVVNDLAALTRAILNPADRASWFAVLRAPWCALTLGALERLAAGGPGVTVRQALTGADGRAAVVRDTLEAAIGQRGRRRLRDLVEAAWVTLGGPACLAGDTDLTDAGRFLDLLDELDEGGDLADFAVLEARCAELFATPDALADGAVQVMTIHKAKGLEFDTVIVPGLDRPQRLDDSRLLTWTTALAGSREVFLMAAKGATGTTDDLYSYIARLERRKEDNEHLRLLYVAATRARRRLHWVAWTGQGARARTSLKALKPGLELLEATMGSPGAPRLVRTLARPLWRLPFGFVPPAPPGDVEIPGPGGVLPAEPISFHWAGETQRVTGLVVHEWLDSIGRTGLRRWTEARVQERREWVRRSLAGRGVPADDLDAAAERAIHAVLNTVRDRRGRWILGDHEDARSEFAITGVVDGALRQAVVDRTFVENRAGSRVRWVVDFKTSTHEGGGRDAFLDNELERYREQLERYLALVAGFDPRPARAGLYFPMLGAWRELKPRASR